MMFDPAGSIFGTEMRCDLSINIDPLGMPESVRRAAVSAIEKSSVYPDPECESLIRVISAANGIEEGNIVCGNGADDLIYRVIHALKPKKAVIAVPTLPEYAKALAEVGCRTVRYLLRSGNDFTLDEGILKELTDDTDMLILCSPNDPTGRLIDRSLLWKIGRRCLDVGIAFMCDERYMELSDGAVSHSVLDFEFFHKDMIVLRDIGVTYAMAGLRLGYALFGSASLATKVRRSGQQWSVSVPAQAAGFAALEEIGYSERAKRLIAEERVYLTGVLEKAGFRVCPSDADFILFESGMPVYEMMLSERILIRSCADIPGLGSGFFRVAVGTHEQNVMFAEAIEKITS